MAHDDRVNRSIPGLDGAAGRLTPGVLGLHLAAISVPLLLAWLSRQPISGDIAFWPFQTAAFALVGIGFVTAGLFAFWRWGSVRWLVAADLAAVLPILALTFWLLGIPVLLLALGALLALRSPVGTGDVRGVPRPRIDLLIAAVIGVACVIELKAALIDSLGFVGAFMDFGVLPAMTAVVFGFGILLWLDRRPGMLLGAGLMLTYWGLVVTFGASEFGRPDIYGLLGLIPGIVAIVVAIRDLLGRSPSDRIVSLLVAAATLGLLLVAPLASPAAIVAAIAFERPGRTAAAPTVSEAGAAGAAGAA